MIGQMSGDAAKLAVVGSLNMDLVFGVALAPEAGQTVHGQRFAIVPGGKGANQAVACARLGAQVSMIGRVGQDAFGAQLTEALRQDGIDVAQVSSDPELPSGVAMVMVDAAAQNRIIVAAGANGALTPDRIDAAAQVIGQAGLLVIQLEVPVETVLHAARIARAHGTKVLLNPAPAPSEAEGLPEALWRCVDYLIPNESEAHALTGIIVDGPDSAVLAARMLRARGVATVLITLGHQGVLIADETGETHLPTAAIQAVDTTAAGDTFIGGFCAGLLEGLAVREAAAFGQKAAAICVSRHGAQPSIPHRREI